MVKVRHSVSTRRRRKRVLKSAKGYFGHRSKRYKQAKRTILRGMAYAYRDRKVKKRDFRSLWVIRINAACREEGLSYSRFIAGLIKANVEINRKVLAGLAVEEPEAFKKLINVAREAVSKN